MEAFTAFLSTIILAISVITVDAQISTPCTASMIAGFTPCINYLTGSSSGGRSPTPSCCASVESLMTTSMDCTCLIVTGNVPFSLPSPINQALAITLPKACNSKSVPLQCRGTSDPLPPAGPALFVPPPPPRVLPPAASSPELPPSPSASETISLAAPPSAATPGVSSEPQAFNEADAPAPMTQQAPAVGPRIRPVVHPVSASNGFVSSRLVMVLMLVVITMNSLSFL